MQNANPQSEFGQSSWTKTATLANSDEELKHNCGYRRIEVLLIPLFRNLLRNIDCVDTSQFIEAVALGS